MTEPLSFAEAEREAFDLLKADQDIYVLATTLSVESAGGLLDERADPHADNATAGALWERLKSEFFGLVCTESQDYSDLREQARNAAKLGNAFGVPAIAALVATKMGLPHALITPFVALLIATSARLGINAWCTEQAAVRAALLKQLDVADP